jgi:hypothetical protein
MQILIAASDVFEHAGADAEGHRARADGLEIPVADPAVAVIGQIGQVLGHPGHRHQPGR